MTTITNITVNESGLAEIAAFLRENHKDGERIANDRSCLIAWAAEAERGLDNGNSAQIEIRSWDAVSGHTVTFEVSEAGLDAEEIEID